jgi:long-chain acyl-CoA synthetase
MIENKLKESSFIEQVMVIGENEKYASAFIVPSFSYLKEWCALHNIKYTTNEEMIKNEDVKKRIVLEVENLNEELAQYEKIKRPELLPREWSIDKNEMTPKLSLKRKVIMAANKDLIEKIYGAE